MEILLAQVPLKCLEALRVLLAKEAETRAVVFAQEVGEILWGFQISPFCESIEVVNAINGKMDWIIESNIF